MDTIDDSARLAVKMFQHGDVLYTTASGAFTLDDAQSTFLDILDAVRENQSVKVLINGRRVTGEPTIIERFFYGEFVADRAKRLGRSSGPLFAYVLHEPVLDPLRLAETVALNRGMNIKVCDDYDEALRWLGVTPSEGI